MINEALHKLGIDIGSTTVKVAVLDKNDNLLFSDYERHFANIRETLASLVQKAYDKLGNLPIAPMITSSLPVHLFRHHSGSGSGCRNCRWRFALLFR